MCDAPSGWRLIRACDEGGVFVTADGNGRGADRSAPDRDLAIDAHGHHKKLTTSRRSELPQISAESPTIGCGWDDENEAFTFPECDGKGRVVGIPRRFRDGRKWTPKGHKRGLIIPKNLKDLPRPVLIVEGPTDVLACLTMGLAAVGRPSAFGGVDYLAELLKDEPRVLVVGEYDPKADGSWPGRDGAKRVAEKLSRIWKRSVRWTMTPGKSKDVRAWFIASGIDPLDKTASHQTGRSLLKLLEVVDKLADPEAAPAPTSPASTSPNKTELGNAERLVMRHGPDLIYLGQKGWMVWDGRRFAEERSRELDARAVDTVRHMYRQAADEPTEPARKALADHAHRSEKRHQVQAMTDLARHMRATDPNQIDADPFAFNVLSGTLDPRTAEQRPHRREDLITKLAPVEFDPSASCPIFDRFLKEVTVDREDLARYLLQLFGIAMTDSVRHR